MLADAPILRLTALTARLPEHIDISLTMEELRVDKLKMKIPIPSLSRNIVWVKLNTGQLIRTKYLMTTEIEKKKSLFHKIMTNF